VTSITVPTNRRCPPKSSAREPKWRCLTEPVRISNRCSKSNSVPSREARPMVSCTKARRRMRRRQDQLHVGVAADRIRRSVGFLRPVDLCCAGHPAKLPVELMLWPSPGKSAALQLRNRDWHSPARSRLRSQQTPARTRSAVKAARSQIVLQIERATSFVCLRWAGIARIWRASAEHTRPRIRLPTRQPRGSRAPAS